MTKRAKVVKMVLIIIAVLGVLTIIGSVGSLELDRISFGEFFKMTLTGLAMTAFGIKSHNYLFN